MPRGCTRLINVLRGDFHGDPHSLLSLLLMIEPLIRWLKSLKSGYTLTSNHLTLSNKWYVDDATLVTLTVADMNAHLEAVHTFIERSGILLNIPKCILTWYIHALHTFLRKVDHNTALQARLDQMNRNEIKLNENIRNSMKLNEIYYTNLITPR